MCRNLVRISYFQLMEIMEKLYQLDFKIKSMEVEPVIGLELFMINFNSVREKRN